MLCFLPLFLQNAFFSFLSVENPKRKFFSLSSAMEAEKRWPESTPLTEAQNQIKRFLNAAYDGDLELFNKLAKELESGKGLAATVAKVKDAKGRGALFFAAAQGKDELCKYLVEELKIDVNEKDIEGQTPVHLAARHGRIATVQYLMEKGANPKIIGITGTALHNAAVSGHIELVKFLLSKGVDIDSRSYVGTPLEWAASHGQKEAVKVLLEHKAKFHARIEDDNMCPLVSAVAANSLPCVELLVKAGADVNVKVGDATIYGETTPLHIAARNGNAEIIKVLLEARADPNATDEDGNKPIQIAAISYNREAVTALLAATSPIQSVRKWSVDGVFEFVESRRKQVRREAGKEANNRPKKVLPEVNPEAKKEAADAKARGDEAFNQNEFAQAKDAYTQAINSDPTDGTLFASRSHCWLRLGKGESALSDAMVCKKLRPDWAEAYNRHGAALCLFERYEEAANAFYRGIVIEPENSELINALKETVEIRDTTEAINKK